MNQVYRSAYAEMYKTYGAGSENVDGIRKTIEVAERLTQQKARLREDARYFLLVNLTEMVVKPLRGEVSLKLEGDASSHLGGDVSSKRLADALNHDLNLLLNVAAQAAHGVEISGHAMVDALSRVWSQLEVNHFGIWN